MRRIYRNRNGFQEDGFFNMIVYRYGFHTKQELRFLLKQHQKLAVVENKKIFLLKCKNNELIPRSLNHNFGSLGDQFKSSDWNRIRLKFLNSLVVLGISQIFRDIKYIKRNIEHSKKWIKGKISRSIFANFMNKVGEAFKRDFELTKINQQKKLEALINEKHREFLDEVNSNVEKWCVNLTDVHVPQSVKYILSLGPKFNMDVKEIPYHEIIASVECGMYSVNEPEKTLLRNEVCNILKNNKIHKNQHRTKDFRVKFLRHRVKEAKEFLRENQNLIVTRADKGNITVIITKEEYSRKMNSLFSDERTYITHNRDLTETIQNKMNKMISEWEKKHYFSTEKQENGGTAKWLRGYAGIIPKAYGLPKVHKDLVPMRPVVSYVGSPLYNLSKFYADILKEVVGKEKSSVKNSYELVMDLKNIRIPTAHKMISFDVKSLFTNVPSKIVNNIVKWKWRSICKFTSLPKDEFLKGLNFILENCYFMFEGVIYQQIFGSPMGAPISPVLANLMMEHLERNVLKTLKFKPAFYYRYVDDIIFTIPEAQIQNTLNRFNNFNSNIQFTMEMEVDRKIAFLDVLLMRNEDGSIVTDWFHKETWSGRYLNYHSYMPWIYKRNTVSILAEKVFKLSDKTLHNKNIRLLVDTLVDNGYPRKIVLDLIDSKKQKLEGGSGQQVLSNESDVPVRYCSVPYKKDIFEKMKYAFKKRNVRLIGRPGDTLKNELFSTVKDKVPLEKRSGVVYNVDCACGANYIGQTCQYVKKRIKQHQDQARSSNVAHSSLTDHVINNPDHKVGWDEFKVIDVERNLSKRLIKEGIHIKKELLFSENICLNTQIDCCNLKDVYVPFI